jgi:hypothetical protein
MYPANNESCLTHISNKRRERQTLNAHSFLLSFIDEKSLIASSGAIRSDVKLVNLGNFSGEKSCGL